MMPLSLSTSGWSSDGLIATMLQGVGAGQFLDQYRDRRAVVLTGASGRFDSLLNDTPFVALAAQAGRLHASFVDVDGWMVNVVIKPAQIQRMLSAGMMVLAEHVPEQGARKTFLDDYRALQPSSQPIQLDVAVCPNTSEHQLGVHSTPVCVFQVSGRFVWRFVPDPVLGGSPLDVTMPTDTDCLPLPWGDLERPPASAFVETIVNPGDTFYLPAGCWHEGHSIGESVMLGATVRRRPAIDTLRGMLEGLDDPASAVATRAQAAIAANSTQRCIAGGWSAVDVHATWQALVDEAVSRSGS